MYKKLNDYIGEMITYKQICEILDLKYQKGNGKDSQLKDIQRYYQLEKVKIKYKIIEKYEEPLEKEDGRKIRRVLEGYCLDARTDDMSGVYAIVLNKFLYVGSTTGSFRKRFYQHKTNNQKHTRKLLKDGALFQPLWTTDIEDEYVIREIEQMYINYFMANPEWNLVNRYEETVCFSEKKKKYKNKTIKVDERQYELALEILRQNGIMIGGGRNE